MNWRHQGAVLTAAWALGAPEGGPIFREARRPMNVVVEDGIVRVVDRQVPDRWRKLPSVDGAGATLLPGLIDAHTHTRRISQLQDAPRFGVTTVLDMWSPDGDRELREAAARRADIRLPFVRHSRNGTGRSWHGIRHPHSDRRKPGWCSEVCC